MLNGHSVRFFGMSENKREEELDLQELTQRAKEGKSLYGESPQPQWVQNAAHQNSVWSQFKFCKFWISYRCTLLKSCFSCYPDVS